MDLQTIREQVEEQLIEYASKQNRQLIRAKDLHIEQLYEYRGKVQAAEDLRGLLMSLLATQ
jgi:hypothetical protein